MKDKTTVKTGSMKQHKISEIDTYAKQAAIPRPINRNKAAKVEFKGSQLISALFCEMARRGESQVDLALVLGVSYGYVSLLGKGHRSATGLSMDALRRAGRYLSIPTAQVALMAEIFLPEDFSLNTTIETRMDNVYAEIKRDPILSGFAVKQEVWNSLPVSAKLMVTVIFENVARTKLLDHSQMVKLH